MLQIIIKGVERVTLDLFQNTELTIGGKSSFFDRKLDEGVASFPLEIPITLHNSKALGAPEDLTQKSTVTEWDIDLIYHGFEFTDFKLKILNIPEFNTSDNYGSYNVVAIGYLGILSNRIGHLKIRDLIKERITFIDLDSRTFATNVMKGNYPEHIYKFGFAPVFCKEWIDDSRSDFNNEEVESHLINRVNVYNNNWTFASRIGGSQAPNAPTIPGSPNYLKHQTVPFFYLKYVVESVFNSIGWKISGDFYNISDLEKIAIFNNCAIEKYRYGAKIDINKQIFTPDHLPDLTIYELIEGLSTFFGLAFSPEAGGIINTRFINPYVSLPKKFNLDGLADVKVNIEFFEESEEGYTFGFKEPADDAKFKDATVEIPQDVITVASYSDMMGTHSQVYYVKSENIYYQYMDGLYSYFAEGLHPIVDKKGGVDYSSTIAPLAKAIYNTESGVTYNLNTLAWEGRGTYYNYSRVKVINPFGFRLMYLTNAAIGDSINQPVATCNSKIAGVQIAQVSMATKGDNNLYEKYHQPFFELLNNSKKVKVKIEGGMGALQVEDLFLTEFTFQGQQFIAVDYELSGRNGAELSITLAQI